MANMFDMMKQVKQLKKMQKGLASRTVEASSRDGLIRVVAAGDMTVKSVTIDPQAVDPANAGKLEASIVSTVNSALDSAKKAAASDMSGLAGGLGGLSGMLGDQG